mmetsp:Transcript_7038/g.15417  ORF Transcript_7038/g.15417 Transcript_7038/m.15417 type:complete len:228 (+) Transcript_7038:461-1144(+)
MLRRVTAPQGAHAHLHQQRRLCGRTRLPLPHRRARQRPTGLCSHAAARRLRQARKRACARHEPHRARARRLQRRHGHGARARRHHLHRVVHAEGRFPRLHRPHVGPDRIRPRLPRLRPHLRPVHAHHLHALRHPDRGVGAEDARGLPADLPARPHPQVPRRARCQGQPQHPRLRDGARDQLRGLPDQGQRHQGGRRGQVLRYHRRGVRRARHQEASSRVVPQVSRLR